MENIMLLSSLARVVNLVEIKVFHNELICSWDVSTRSVILYILQPKSRSMTNSLVQKHVCHMPQIMLSISHGLRKRFLSSQAMSHIAFIICYKSDCPFSHPLNLQTYNETQMQCLFVGEKDCWNFSCFDYFA